MPLADVTLDDKYARETGTVFLTGLQALVRLPIMQRRADAAAGLNTAGYISGYRGSPIGRYDIELWRAAPFLDRHHIRFQPGLNEELAATAIWGAQQVNLHRGAKYDGVFGIWYGKAPGVDRSGDAFKHATLAGTSRYGGVLAVAADDHFASSSAVAHQSEFAFVDAMMPVLNPAGVQDFLDLGLAGFALSRYCGAWVGFKTVADTIESSGTAAVDPDRARFDPPDDFELPEGGLNIRLMDPVPTADERNFVKLEAARAFVRANGLDRVVVDGPRARLGLAATGKGYADLREALRILGIDEAMAADIGLRLYKVAMPWPLEDRGAARFAAGLEEIMVVEERRSLIESQFKELLYHDGGPRPRVVGKTDERGRPLLPPHGGLTPEIVARALAARILSFHDDARLRDRLAGLEAAAGERVPAAEPGVARVPHFCPGCPHNTSTRVPEGSRAVAGVGCHTMAVWMDRDTHSYTQMGGEGVTWIGQAPFTETGHVYQNMGDGTYVHSGILGIRAAVAAKVNITFKILFNDAVAMTGGQPTDGMLTVPILTRQLAAEGVAHITVVSDDPGRFRGRDGLAAGVEVHHRDDFERIQRDVRERRGVSVIVYDQVCAAELRRRRKRGACLDPAREVVINEAVCEGCGDCSLVSNCLAVVPVETEFGRKRAIDADVCNKDFSCLKGFCPSLVTVEGGVRRPPPPAAADLVAELPDAPVADCAEPYGILVAGIGGTGVVTLGALLGMAAHIEGKACTVLDMTGMAQKGGAVLSHVRVAERPGRLHAARIAVGAADLVLGCDVVVAGAPEVLDKIRAGDGRAVINSHKAVTAAFTHDPAFEVPADDLARAIAAIAGRTEIIDSVRAATALLGGSASANVLLLGYACQKGWVPVSVAAIERAIELNGVAVAGNLRALRLGREAAHDPEALRAALAAHAQGAAAEDVAATPEDAVERRAAYLADYQNPAYAARFRALVERARTAEAACAKGMTGLWPAVARGYFKLLSYKDEYEVARLLADPAFRERLARRYEGDFRIVYHLAPPALTAFEGRRAAGGERPRKRAFGPWILPLLRLLARLKALRGTPFDPFGYSAERRTERQLIADYEALIDELLAGLGPENHGLAVTLAALPEEIRGFGPVKAEAITAVKAREAELLARFRDPASRSSAAD